MTLSLGSSTKSTVCHRRTNERRLYTVTSAVFTITTDSGLDVATVTERTSRREVIIMHQQSFSTKMRTGSWQQEDAGSHIAINVSIQLGWRDRATHGPTTSGTASDLRRGTSAGSRHVGQTLCITSSTFILNRSSRQRVGPMNKTRSKERNIDRITNACRAKTSCKKCKTCGVEKDLNTETKLKVLNVCVMFTTCEAKMHHFIFAIALSEPHISWYFLAPVYFNRFSITHLFHILYNLSQKDRVVGWVSYGQKWETVTGRQYLQTL